MIKNETGQVYLMECKQYYYVGVHCGDIFTDKYYGSGLAWKNIINKYGKENVKRIIIDTFNNKEDKNILERKYISIYKQKYGNKCVNISDGGDGGNLGPDVCKKISYSVSGEKNGMYGKKLSLESREKISRAIKGHPNYNTGGYKHTEDAKKRIGLAHKNFKMPIEAIEKIRAARKNQLNLNLTSNKGKHWYINTSENKEYCFYENEVPDGWIRGRLRSKCNNKIYYHNGDKEILLSKDEIIPDNFIKGRKPRKTNCYTIERNQKISKALKNRIVTQETREKISKAIRGRKWYNNGSINKQLFYCPDGWIKGKIKHENS